MIGLLIVLVFVLIKLDAIQLKSKLVTLNINGLVDSYVTKSETVGELVDELDLGATVVKINPNYDALVENKLIISMVTENQKANQTITDNLAAAKKAAEPPPEPKKYVPTPEVPEVEPEPKSPSYYGWATWYRQFDGFYAASTIFPRGSKLKVVSVASGKSIIVKINDYGPEAWTGVSIDLNDWAFKELAPLGAGKIYVKFYLI
ncbi:MAG: septal ring lytic transglycosylase RlpA family protein [Patescibacteria group bacterium]|nr:septal ring lytic transglycosylase RlpA family protein [Patescibacteria group bacterium]